MGVSIVEKDFTENRNVKETTMLSTQEIVLAAKATRDKFGWNQPIVMPNGDVDPDFTSDCFGVFNHAVRSVLGHPNTDVSLGWIFAPRAIAPFTPPPDRTIRAKVGATVIRDFAVGLQISPMAMMRIFGPNDDHFICGISGTTTVVDDIEEFDYSPAAGGHFFVVDCQRRMLYDNNYSYGGFSSMRLSNEWYTELNDAPPLAGKSLIIMAIGFNDLASFALGLEPMSPKYV
jgi:hypothetical protein